MDRKQLLPGMTPLGQRERWNIQSVKRLHVIALIVAMTAAPLLSQDKPTSGQSCQHDEKTAQEVLQLGRTLGYPDDQIVEAYGSDPCATLSYLRHETQAKTPSEKAIVAATAPKERRGTVTIRVVRN